MKQLFVLTIVICYFLKAGSQTKVPIAIFPFVSALPEYRSHASQIQQGVIELLRKKSTIEIIDRSNDSLLVKELDLQIREQSIAAGGLVQQGKILGAKQMIVGTISNISLDSKTTSALSLLTKKNNSATEYTASISFALQLSDVETGKVISQRVFNTKEANAGKLLSLANIGTGSSKQEAITHAINASNKQISAWINESYPPEINILKVEETDKKGYPETILITGIDASLQKGAELHVNEIEMLDAGGGKTLRRTKKIAELKIKEIQGDITVCKVTDGAKTLQEKMTAGAKMEFIVK